MKKTLAVALLSTFAATAFAADSGFYAGVSLGQSKSGNPWSGVTVTKDTDTVFGVLAGYQFNKNWGAEAFYTGAGKLAATAVGHSASSKADALGIVAVGTLPLFDAFSLYVKLGYAQAKASGTAIGMTIVPLDVSRSAATYGLGGQYNVSQSTGIRFGWDRYGAASKDSNDGVTFFTTNYNVDVYSLAAVFKF